MDKLATSEVAAARHGPGEWPPLLGRVSVAEQAVPVPIERLRAVDSIRLAGVDRAHVRLLAEMAAQLPPILVHRGTMRVIDGMHRLRVAELRGEHTIRVQYVEGSEQDAYVLGLTMNVTHGLPLSLADRKAAAMRVIRSHAHWSNRGIASVVGLSHKTVGVLRRRLAGEIPQSDTRIGRDGHVSATSAGRPIAAATPADDREAPTLSVVRAHREATQDPMRQTDILETLRGDPALRFSETGRVLLRLLALPTMTPQTWSVLIGTVPRHCRAAVIEAANECATAWRQFADQLA